MHLGALLHLPLALSRAVLAVLRGRLGALCWSLAPLSLHLPLPLPGWRRGPVPSPSAPPAPHRQREQRDEAAPTPTSVNYHFTRQCNYKCGFCFHTAKTSFVLPLEEAKRGLEMLKEAGMEKINFSGGEPFLQDRGEFVGQLVQFCKEELKLPSVSIVSNGSLIRERWFKKYGKRKSINRCTHMIFQENKQTKKNVISEIVVLLMDCKENMSVILKASKVLESYQGTLCPQVFQCLLIEGENSGDDALREAEKFVISDEEFEQFLDRHRDISCLVPESNQKMRDSYLILDEYMRFLNCRNGRKEPSNSILDVGVEAAIKFSGFDEKMFLKRGGKYVWSKADMKLDW
uniref:Radical S-adenosyl methionine domain containing 2 n=1 Tax=Anas platyrhynchos platyrhynchos TaxID=8840 RepID=U3IED8_ANAPP